MILEKADNKTVLEKGQIIRYDGLDYQTLYTEKDEVVCTLKSYSSPRYRFKLQNIAICRKV